MYISVYQSFTEFGTTYVNGYGITAKKQQLKKPNTMKTQTNISNLKKMAVTACAAIVMTIGTYAQPSPEKQMNDEMIAMNRLSVVMDRTEESLRYNAPAPAETEETDAAISRLDALTAMNESAVAYSAPEVVETVAEMSRLDDQVYALEAAILYKAPAADGDVIIEEELARLDSLIDHNEALLVFHAPAEETVTADQSEEVVETLFADNK